MVELVHIALGALALLLAYLAGRGSAGPSSSICQLDKLTTGPAKIDSPDPSQSLPSLRDDEESRRDFYASTLSTGGVWPEGDAGSLHQKGSRK